MSVVNLEVSEEESEVEQRRERPVPRYKQVTVIGEGGEVISDCTTWARTTNGGGFVISYTAKMCEFLEKTRQGSFVRVFLYIAHHQNYGTNGVYGYRTSRLYLTKVLGLTRKTVYSALEYLIEKFLIVENRIDGSLEFMVNPAYVTIGGDKKAREREWNLRWQMYNKLHSEK